MDRGLQLARAIAVEHGLPQRPARVVEDLGSVNHVVVVGSDLDQWVIRFAKDARSPDVFGAEAWCANQAAARGVPTPAPSAFGTLDGVPYGVQRFIPGLPGDAFDRPDLWSVLGAYGGVINEIQPEESAPATLFSRFGRDLAQAWEAHLAYNLARLDDDDPLLHRAVYTREQQRRTREAILDLADVPMRFGLSHGDLTSRNLIIPEVGPAVLLDWGSASFGPVPWTDLLLLDREARQAGAATGPDLAAFTVAMGLRMAEMWPTFEAFRRLQLLDLVRWAADQRPERLPGAIDDVIATL